jgi:SGNH hydrolase-like domain, acetyltransferase AlgX
VADDDVFTGRLETPLSAARGSPVEVINVGRNGTSTIRELDLYMLIGRWFSPDIVVLAYFLGNDLREVVEEHDAQELRQWHPQGTARRVAYGLCPNLYLDLALLKMSAAARESSQPRTENEILSALRRECEQNGADFASASAAYSRLPTEVKRGMEQKLLRDHQILVACFDPARLRRSLDPDDAYFQRAWPRTERHLELLRQAITADHAQFVVLILPDAVQVDPAAHQFAAEISYETDSSWLTASCRTQRAVADWCCSTGVPCLDLTDELRRSPEPLYYRQDGHFNPAGHQRTAELLAEFLRERIEQAK